ncbi:MAG: hypothetical protein FWG31_07415 [Oscillospiraceae bacterium]|nr:hypothetical protein [Oscillospiraceae bacterium]
MTRLLIVFGMLLPAALLLEGVLLPVFKIPLKGNAVRLLCVIFAAQIVQSIVISRSLAGPGPVWTIFILFFTGFVLMIVKALVYEQILKAKKGKQSLTYGVVATMVSWAVFSVALFPLHTFLDRMDML